MGLRLDLGAVFFEIEMDWWKSHLVIMFYSKSVESLILSWFRELDLV
jgi:hypothetical protein